MTNHHHLAEETSLKLPATGSRRPHTVLMAVIGAAVAFNAAGGSARAQQPGEAPLAADPNAAAAPAPPADNPPSAAPETPPAAPVVQTDPAVTARLDDIDQTARIAARRIENLEEQLAARAKETPALQTDDKGFLIKSADGAYSLRFNALLQVDSRWFVNDGALSDRADTFLIRRFRPGLSGTLFNLVDVRLTPDFAGGTVAVFDGYIDLHPAPYLRLRTGKFKTPLGLERPGRRASEAEHPGVLPGRSAGRGRSRRGTDDKARVLPRKLMKGSINVSRGIGGGRAGVVLPRRPKSNGVTRGIYGISRSPRDGAVPALSRQRDEDDYA